MVDLPNYRMKLQNAAGLEPYVDFDSFSTAAKAWSDILDKLASQAMTEDDEKDVIWVVTGLRLASAEVTIEPRVIEEQADDTTPLTAEFWSELGEHLAQDLERLESGALPEEVFPDAFLPQIYSLISPFRDQGVETIEFQFADHTILLTRNGAGIHQRHVVREKSIGSVTGRLTSVSFSGRRPQFGLRPEGGTVIQCRFDVDQLLQKVTASLRKRVTVYGQLERNEHGEIMLVRSAWDLIAHPPEDDLPDVDDMFGAVPDVIGNLTSEDWIAMVRGRA